MSWFVIFLSWSVTKKSRFTTKWSRIVFFFFVRNGPTSTLQCSPWSMSAWARAIIEAIVEPRRSSIPQMLRVYSILPSILGILGVWAVLMAKTLRVLGVWAVHMLEYKQYPQHKNLKYLEYSEYREYSTPKYFSIRVKYSEYYSNQQ